SKVPSPRNRPEQGVVDCEKRAEQWSIVRIDGEDDFAACKSPHARYKRERDIAQFSYEGAVNNLLKIVGGKLIPETVSGREEREADRQQDREPPEALLGQALGRFFLNQRFASLPVVFNVGRLRFGDSLFSLSF